jgi:hypothetical protein
MSHHVNTARMLVVSIQRALLRRSLISGIADSQGSRVSQVDLVRARCREIPKQLGPLLSPGPSWYDSHP